MKEMEKLLPDDRVEATCIGFDYKDKMIASVHKVVSKKTQDYRRSVAETVKAGRLLSPKIREFSRILLLTETLREC